MLSRLRSHIIYLYALDVARVAQFYRGLLLRYARHVSCRCYVCRSFAPQHGLGCTVARSRRTHYHGLPDTHLFTPARLRTLSVAYRTVLHRTLRCAHYTHRVHGFLRLCVLPHTHAVFSPQHTRVSVLQDGRAHLSKRALSHRCAAPHGLHARSFYTHDLVLRFAHLRLNTAFAVALASFAFSNISMLRARVSFSDHTFSFACASFARLRCICVCVSLRCVRTRQLFVCARVRAFARLDFDRFAARTPLLYVTRDIVLRTHAHLPGARLVCVLRAYFTLRLVCVYTRFARCWFCVGCLLFAFAFRTHRLSFGSSILLRQCDFARSLRFVCAHLSRFLASCLRCFVSSLPNSMSLLIHLRLFIVCDGGDLFRFCLSSLRFCVFFLVRLVVVRLI